jgi:patatin-like phospholipase/acyl hydrolase
MTLSSSALGIDSAAVTHGSPVLLRPDSPQTIKILSIDGGGIRGIIPAVILARIEQLTSKPIAQLFDLVAGTSTGGILTLGLTIPKTPGGELYSARNFVEMFEREGHRIFSRTPWRAIFTSDSLLGKKYSSRGIETVLAEYFGDSRLSHAVTDVLVTSYEIERRFPLFFKSASARRRPDYDFPARDIARATSAAPTYFEPMRIPTGTNSDYYTLIDGGVFANNPAACALVEARIAHPDAARFLVVSLGTGSTTETVPVDQARHWGVLQWAKPLLEAIFDGVSSTVDYQLRELLPSGYYRFQTTLDGHNHALDNTSTENLTALKSLANELIEKESEALDELCQELTTSRSRKE